MTDRSIQKHIASITVFALIAAICFFLLKNLYLDPMNDTHPDSGDTQSTINQNEPSSDNKAPDKEPEKSKKDNVLKESPDAGEDYLSKVTVIGDMTTYAMKEYLPTLNCGAMRVWSLSENISPSRAASLSDFRDPYTGEATSFVSVFKEHPTSILIISLGSFDGDAEMNENSLKSSLHEFITYFRGLQPSPIIIIQSVFPVTDECEVLTPDEVMTRNEWLKNFCSEGIRYYLDTFSCLADENGRLKAEYASPDGYTLNAEGYTAVLNYIRTHVPPSVLK